MSQANKGGGSVKLGLVSSLIRSLMGVAKMDAMLVSLGDANEERGVFEISKDIFEMEVGSAGLDRLADADLSAGCVMVANHPRGILDLFATGYWITTNMPTAVKCLGNRMIGTFIPALLPYLISVDNMAARGEGRSAYNREAFETAKTLINAGGVLGVCPAGEVASLRLRSPEGWFRVSDHPWNMSFVGLALELKVPIVPIHVSGKNRLIYYLIRLFGRIFGRLANIRELVASRNQNIVVSVGRPLLYEDYKSLEVHEIANLVRKNLYAAPSEVR